MSDTILQPSASPRRWQIPGVMAEQRLLGGVAAGIAVELGVETLLVRLVFVLLFAVGGWGALLYLALWGGLSLAHYQGIVPTHPAVPKGRDRPRRLIGLALVTLGLALFLAQLGGLRQGLIWPLALMGAGVLIGLRRLQLREQESSGRLPHWVSQVGGVLMAGAGCIAFLGSTSAGIDAASTLVVSAAFAGLATFLAPWWFRLVTDLDTERQARARSDERAEVAAHLHDSVLQTLALIQKGDDPQKMVGLARRQERELRNYLDPDRVSRSGGSLRGRLDEVASDVEELFGVPVEVVTVGDALCDGPTEAIVSAAREATVNAAKHSGAGRVDVFAEVSSDCIEIFVRDTGKGFDPGAVASSRRGLAESIVGRMERVGGVVEVHTAPGEGTEIELRIERQSGARSQPNQEQG